MRAGEVSELTLFRDTIALDSSDGAIADTGDPRRKPRDLFR
jgi:hypothetical protein